MIRWVVNFLQVVWVEMSGGLINPYLRDKMRMTTVTSGRAKLWPRCLGHRSPGDHIGHGVHEVHGHHGEQPLSQPSGAWGEDAWGRVLNEELTESLDLRPWEATPRTHCGFSPLPSCTWPEAINQGGCAQEKGRPSLSGSNWCGLRADESTPGLGLNGRWEGQGINGISTHVHFPGDPVALETHPVFTFLAPECTVRVKFSSW